MSASDSNTTRAVIAVAVAIFLWGFSGVLVKSVETQPILASCYRLWFGVALLWTVALFRGKALSIINWRWLRLSTAGGLLFGVHQILFFTSLDATRIANVTIIASLQPALVAFISGPIFSEATPWRALPYLGVALTGMVIVVTATNGLPGVETYGNAIATANLFAFTAYFLASKRIRDHLGSIEFITGMTTIAALMVSAVVLVTISNPVTPSQSDIAKLIAVAILPGTIGHILLAWAHPYLSAFTISTTILAIPVIASVAAFFFLGEALTQWQILGGGVTLAGVAMVLRTTTDASAPS